MYNYILSNQLKNVVVEKSISCAATIIYTEFAPKGSPFFVINWNIVYLIKTIR